MKARQQTILQLLGGGRELSVDELARHFGVASVTIRRDLEALAATAAVTRTHGGAVLAQAGVVEFRFRERAQEQLAAKQALAGFMAGVVKAGMSVVLDTGTTTLAVARALGAVGRLQVLTTSLAIASALQAHEQLDLVLLGGSVRQGSPDLSGPLTEENLRRFRPDLAIVGADALDAGGAYTGDLGVAAISAAMLAGAHERWLVADSTKFARQSLVHFAGWHDLDHLVTDTAVPAEARAWLREAGPELHLVAPAEKR